jgi:hypothetical protein
MVVHAGIPALGRLSEAGRLGVWGQPGLPSEILSKKKKKKKSIFTEAGPNIILQRLRFLDSFRVSQSLYIWSDRLFASVSSSLKNKLSKNIPKMQNTFHLKFASWMIYQRQKQKNGKIKFWLDHGEILLKLQNSFLEGRILCPVGFTSQNEVL